MIWPGWGHASENPELPKAFEDTGIEFIGPSAEYGSISSLRLALY